MGRIKGVAVKADCLSCEVLLYLFDRLHKDKLFKWELFCRISFYLALRVSDVLSLRWSIILDKSDLIFPEQKTGKRRPIKIKPQLRSKLRELYGLLGSPDKNDYLFINYHTGRPYTSKHVNTLLKEFRFNYKIKIKNFSTHTFRKSFGRYVYEAKGRSAEALVLLNDILNHSDVETTKIYISIRQEEIDEIFNMIPV